MSLRVLLIEDELKSADVVVRGLRDEGCFVRHERDRRSGWTSLTNNPWDVVLLDWGLRDNDGLTLLKFYREQGGGSPVLMLSARVAVVDRVQGLNAGADDYLCKPFEFVELVARIQALSRRRFPASTLLTLDDLTLDLTTYRVERAGRRLDLTPKEFALLLLFLRHPSEVLSKSRIYEEVWDDSYDNVSNTLEVHVVELRRKLEAHGSRLIETLRGRGYRFGVMAPEEYHDSQFDGYSLPLVAGGSR